MVGDSLVKVIQTRQAGEAPIVPRPRARRLPSVFLEDTFHSCRFHDALTGRHRELSHARRQRALLVVVVVLLHLSLSTTTDRWLYESLKSFVSSALSVDSQAMCVQSNLTAAVGLSRDPFASQLPTTQP